MTSDLLDNGWERIDESDVKLVTTQEGGMELGWRLGGGSRESKP
jgi:hypothetical protein